MNLSCTLPRIESSFFFLSLLGILCPEASKRKKGRRRTRRRRNAMTPNVNAFDNEFKFAQWKFIIHADPSFITYSLSHRPVSLTDFIRSHYFNGGGGWLILLFELRTFIEISEFLNPEPASRKHSSVRMPFNSHAGRANEFFKCSIKPRYSQTISEQMKVNSIISIFYILVREA